MCFPSNEVFEAIFRGLHEDKLCDRLQAMASTNVKTVQQQPQLHMESNPDGLGSFSPTGHCFQQQSGQIMLQSFLIKPKFLKTTRHAEIKKLYSSAEAHGGGRLEPVKLTREPASSHSHPSASLKNAPGFLTVRRS